MKTLLGILVIISVVFGFKFARQMGTVKVKGVVTEICSQIAYTQSYFCTSRSYGEMKDHPVAAFVYKGQLYKTEEYNVKFRKGINFENDYNVGDSIGLYFSKNKPEKADFYSLSTYWFTIDSLILIFILSLVWIGGYYIYCLPSTKKRS